MRKCQAWGFYIFKRPTKCEMLRCRSFWQVPVRLQNIPTHIAIYLPMTDECGWKVDPRNRSIQFIVHAESSLCREDTGLKRSFYGWPPNRIFWRTPARKYIIYTCEFVTSFEIDENGTSSGDTYIKLSIKSLIAMFSRKCEAFTLKFIRFLTRFAKQCAPRL